MTHGHYDNNIMILVSCMLWVKTSSVPICERPESITFEKRVLQVVCQSSSLKYKGISIEVNIYLAVLRSFAKGLSFSGFTGKSLLNQRG